MIDFIIVSLILLQTIAIFGGSFIILQNVLHESSSGLRLSFILFPASALLEFLSIYSTHQYHIYELVLNFAILFLMYWLYAQKDIIFLNKIKSKNNKPYSFTNEISCIATCFAVWIIKQFDSHEFAEKLLKDEK